MHELTPLERKQMRGMAMKLKPAVLIGQAGLTESVLNELEQALAREELIKVRFGGNRELIAQQCAAIVAKLTCVLCGKVGHTASFYRKKQIASSS